ncbi:condensation domain-containing protein [Prescottella defluvii]|nr:condensation domain-containing protein [Prescottella defluvii]
MWFAQQLTPGVPIYIAQYVALHGDLDIDLLHDCALIAAEEFQSPYLRLVEIDGEPWQLLDRNVDTSIAVVDLRDRPDPMAAAHEWIGSRLLRSGRRLPGPADRVHGPEGGRPRLFVVQPIHHVALDGYSGMTIASRIAALYTAAVEHREAEPNRALDLRELLEIDRKYRASSRFQADREYWADHIAGIESGSTLARNDGPVAGGQPVPQRTAVRVRARRRSTPATAGSRPPRRPS